MSDVRRLIVPSVAVVVLAVGLGVRGPAPSRVLSIAPVYQQTPVWCWAAVGEMVFRYYGVPTINPGGNYQCGIIALVHPVCDGDCFRCPVPAGSRQSMVRMLTEYPDVAASVTGRSADVRVLDRPLPLSLRQTQEEIDAGRPVVAGISPSGYNTSAVSQHVALIVGYDGEDLVVNDPFPFDQAFQGNPYEAAGGWERRPGQYVIAYGAFIDALDWRETIYRVRCVGADCRGEGASEVRSRPTPAVLGRSCCTAYGRCGPFYDQPPLPVGSACYCGTPYGSVPGRVCQ